MKAQWLLETACHQDTIDDFRIALQKQNVPFRELLDVEIYSRKLKFCENDCVLFHGSIQGAKYIQKNTSVIPGAWLNSEFMNCKHYYSYLGEFLINQNYTMLPFSEFKRKRESVIENFGRDGKVFIRPASGHKIFTGQVVSTEEDIRGITIEEPAPETLIVAAEPKEILREWRFVVANDQVITGSLYLSGDYFTPTRERYDKGEAWDLAQNVINTGFRPDPMWTLDIGETKDGLGLLEIGAFSCSGLYKCDPDVIVEYGTRLAEEEWTDIMVP
jgi:hypothetical protein